MPGVFELLLFSCVTALWPASSDLMSKTCRWQTTGVLYATQERCSADGNAKIGTPIFSDVYEDRRVEQIRCQSRSVVY